MIEDNSDDHRLPITKYSRFAEQPFTPPKFADVPEKRWAYEFVETLAENEITSGCGGGNYCPNATVTRDQIAVILVGTFGL